MLAFALAFAVAGTASQAEENLAQNSGFEDGDKGWTFSTFGGKAQGRVAEGEGRDGGNAYLIEVDATGRGVVITDWIPVKSGRHYRFSFWARAEAEEAPGAKGPRCWGYACWYDKAKKKILPHPGTSVTSSSEWSQVSGHEKAPANACWVRFYLFNRTEPDGAGTPVKAWYDDVVVQPFLPLYERIKTPKPVYPDTVLATGGKPAACIVVPDEPALVSLAEEIRAVIANASGARLPMVRADEWQESTAGRENLVLVGHALNNPAILRLYAWYYTCVDADYPGPKGWVLQTVSDPWGTGKNAVILGASTVEGVAAATAEFIGLIHSDKELRIPRQASVHLGRQTAEHFRRYANPPDEEYIRDYVERAEKALEAGKHGGATGYVTGAGLDYMRSGKEGYAKLCAALIDLMWKDRQKNRQIHGGPWGMDADFNLWGVVTALDLIEESPSLTDADRLRLTGIVARYCDHWTNYGSIRSVRTQVIRHNHTTFTSLGMLFSGRYFSLYYPPCPEAERWSLTARLAFAPMLDQIKPQEDSNSYQWIPARHVLRYSLATGDMTYFGTGAARRFADLAIGTMDNLGYQVSFGDVGYFTGGSAEFCLWRACAWYYQTGRYNWALNKADEVRRVPEFDLNGFATHHSPEPPTDLIGLNVFPVGKGFYEYFRGSKAGVDHSQAFDKIVMRSGFDPRDEYLLLDGLACGGHRHYDGNCITRISARGRIWLADCDYIKALPKFHCGVLVFRDATSQTMPPFCKLMANGETEDYALSSTLTPGYSGIDWQRSILWLKGLGFVVRDGMSAAEDGDYSLRQTWHLLGDIGHDGAGRMTMVQQGEAFDLAFAEPLPRKLTEDWSLGRNWGSYPFAAPVVRIRQQLASCKLAAGERFSFHTALVPRSADAPPASLVAGRDDGLFLSANGRRALVGFGGRAGALEVVGEAWVIEREQAAFLSAKCVRLGGCPLLVADPAVSVQLGSDGRILLECESETEVALMTDNRLYSIKMREHRPVEGLVKIKLAPGTHEFRLAGHAHPWPRLASLLDDLPAGGPALVVSPALLPSGGLDVAWRCNEFLLMDLVTGNQGMPGARKSGVRISTEPPPLDKNAFAPDDQPNTLAALTDGRAKSTQDSVMWQEDKPVTLTVDLGGTCRIGRVRLLAWWGLKSSKDRYFATESIVLKAHAPGGDWTIVAEVADKGPHPDWGTPLEHNIECKGTTADRLSFELTPRTGCGVYLGELLVWALPEDAAASGRPPVRSPVPPALASADVDGDGAVDAVLGNSAGSLGAVSSDGRLLAKIALGHTVRVVACDDLDGDGATELLAGTEDGRLSCFSVDGRKLWEHTFARYKRSPIPCVLLTDDLDGDGSREVIVGTESWRFYCFDSKGSKLWLHETVHASTCGAVADVDGDGKSEVLAGTEYYWWHCLNSEGGSTWGYRSHTGPRANAVTAGDLDGDGKKEVYFAGADGNVHALDSRGKLLWRYNTGDEVTSLVVLPGGEGSRQVLLAGSLSFSVYAFNAGGERLWRRDMGESVLGLVKGDYYGMPVAYASVEDGSVAVITALGRIVAAGKLAAVAGALAPAREGIFAHLDDGALLKLSPAPLDRPAR